MALFRVWRWLHIHVFFYPKPRRPMGILSGRDEEITVKSWWAIEPRQKPISRSIQLHHIPVTAFWWTDLFSDRISPEWDSRGSAMINHKINRRHCVAGPEVPFFQKRKDILKIDQSVKVWHRLSMGVACSYSSVPGQGSFLPSRQAARFFVSRPKMVIHLCLAQRPSMFLFINWMAERAKYDTHLDSVFSVIVSFSLCF